MKSKPLKVNSSISHKWILINHSKFLNEMSGAFKRYNHKKLCLHGVRTDDLPTSFIFDHCQVEQRMIPRPSNHWHLRAKAHIVHFVITQSMIWANRSFKLRSTQLVSITSDDLLWTILTVLLTNVKMNVNDRRNSYLSCCYNKF